MESANLLGWYFESPFEVRDELGAAWSFSRDLPAALKRALKRAKSRAKKALAASKAAAAGGCRW